MNNLLTLFIIGLLTDYVASRWIYYISKSEIYHAVVWTIISGILSCYFVDRIVTGWSFKAVGCYVSGLAIGTFVSIAHQKYSSLKKSGKYNKHALLNALKGTFSNKEEFIIELAQILYFEMMAKKSGVKMYALGDRLSDEIWNNLEESVKTKYLKIAQKKCQKDIKLNKFLASIK
jgi:hypothetical protein